MPDVISPYYNRLAGSVKLCLQCQTGSMKDHKRRNKKACAHFQDWRTPSLKSLAPKLAKLNMRPSPAQLLNHKSRLYRSQAAVGPCHLLSYFEKHLNKLWEDAPGHLQFSFVRPFALRCLSSGIRIPGRNHSSIPQTRGRCQN